MKKIFTLFIIAFVAISFIAPTAEAREFSKAERGVGRVLLCPFKALGRTVHAVGETVTVQKPLATLSLPKAVRQEAFDVVEGTGRVFGRMEPIPADGVGSVNTAITDAGLDQFVDAVVYGGIVGCVVHNGNSVGAVHHVGKAIGVAAGSAVVADIIDDAVN